MLSDVESHKLFTPLSCDSRPRSGEHRNNERYFRRTLQTPGSLLSDQRIFHDAT